ncbi:MAG: hypothetical protein L0387_39980 [Acidobacteria bacterium]|nr:hypothetical protein [Acidobacteriota bacterium]MCI0627767.1 hypothetical protein [Acidobacteriota bacterium]MCI0718583.1 hypothetical protein [Acidobacteriota bacterium]
MTKYIRILTIALLAGCLVSLLTLRADREDGKRARLTKEQELARELDKLDKRLQRVREYAALSSKLVKEVEPLLADAARLQQQARSSLASGQTYVAERLKSASRNVAEAVEHLANARLNLKWDDDDGRSENPNRDDDSEKDAARELERAYFRTAQLDFFARQKGAGGASEWVTLGRRLYQEGRAVFDKKEYFKARQLAKASSELSSAVEKYLQSQLPEELPPPPKVNRP